jgi:hypothetical protein
LIVARFLKAGTSEARLYMEKKGSLALFFKFFLELNKFRRNIHMQNRSENVKFLEYWFSTRHTSLVFSGIHEILFIFSTVCHN